MIRQPIKRRILLCGISFLLIITSLTLGLPNTAQAQLIPQTSSSQIAAVSASAAFKEAYENRYTWDEKFPGYSAEVSINEQGELDQGIIRVEPDLSVEVLNIDREDVRQLIANQLKMEVIHRRRIPFEQRHDPNSFELEGTDESGALKIREVADKSKSQYKVKDQVITQVNRLLGDVAVTVDTLGIAKNPEGYVVTHFQTSFRDPQTGEVLEKLDVRDFHEKIGSYYLLTNRTIRKITQGNPEDKLVPDILIRFNDIQGKLHN
ncbi:DUF3386 family protein [Lyngbya aestuarii]|uniref:DUF3386 family protein n=1 Tax=Lyngbya aestuarii TaxID=118322 RepID=UPI00403DA4B3